MRVSPLRRDLAGTIDIPYKLLVSVVIMALAASVLLPVLRAYQESTMEDRVDLVISKIAAAARTAYHHPGSSRTVVVDVPPAGGVRLERLSIGGNLSKDLALTSTIRWELSTGASGTHAITTPGGFVPMTGPDDEAVVVGAGPSVLVLEAKEAPTGWAVDHVVVVTVL